MDINRTGKYVIYVKLLTDTELSWGKEKEMTLHRTSPLFDEGIDKVTDIINDFVNRSVKEIESKIGEGIIKIGE
jgi:hypothetical protein